MISTRPASGTWRHPREKTIGEGDIPASYSADRIGMGQPVRKPFAWEGKLWICVGKNWCRGDESAEAYRLIHPAMHAGAPVSYAEKVADGDAARADPNGFYHGLIVLHDGGTFILCGPPGRGR